MNSVAILNTQFVQVALPLMVTLALAAWLNNRGIDGLGKRIDDMGKRIDDFRSDVNRRFENVDRRFDEVNRRFDRVDAVLQDHGQKIARLEERTSPLARH